MASFNHLEPPVESRISIPAPDFQNMASSIPAAEGRGSMTSSDPSSAIASKSPHPILGKNNHPILSKNNRRWARQATKDWIRNPFNMVYLLWITFVAISGAILFMVITGMLNSVLPSKSQHDLWFEASNQTLNALFTLMCLYQHPRRFHHLVLLCRWQPKDITTLREIYCKDGARKPRERAHMAVVVALLHLNCLAQYASCGLNLGYPKSGRPSIGVGVSISAALSAPVIAAIYNTLSPLGRASEFDDNVEDPSPEERCYFVTREEGTRVDKPQWAGGLLDLWEDMPTTYLSLFCCLCMFSWNMNRLGLGNMYVHMATFALLFIAPLLILSLEATHIDSATVQEVFVCAGAVLCVLGLLYGGFWRIQMRKRFNLPGNQLCCGHPAMTDFLQWLCCCCCSLAQELRTANNYDVSREGCRNGEGVDGVAIPLEAIPPLSPGDRKDLCTETHGAVMSSNACRDIATPAASEHAAMKVPSPLRVSRENIKWVMNP